MMAFDFKTCLSREYCHKTNKYKELFVNVTLKVTNNSVLDLES